MLQDMDSMVASCISYVKVGKLNHLENSRIWLVSVNEAGIVRLTVQHRMIVSVSFMYYPWEFCRQTSANGVFPEKCPIHIYESCDFGSRTPRFNPVIELSQSDRLNVSHGTVGNPCNLQPYAAAISFSITYDLAATYAILTHH